VSERIIGVGVVGIGFGQQVHVPAFRLDPRCRVVALAASTADRAANVAGKLGVPKSYGDWRQLIADRDVQLVSIAVPPSRQAEIAIAAARAGKALFCEKPSAATLHDARAMLVAAEAAHVPHAIDLMFPEIPAWKAAKDAVPRLGKLRHAAVTWRVETYAVKNNLVSWKTSTDEGGGALLNFVSHSMYYLDWLLGRIVAVTARVNEVRVDAWLETAAGVPINLAVANDSYLGPGHRLEIYGQDGTLLLDNPGKDHTNGFKLLIGDRSAEQLKPVDAPGFPAGVDGRVAAMSSIVTRLVDAITRGENFRGGPSLREGLRVQQLIEAMRTSHRTGARTVVDRA
jgi:predicted dehydrogenase